MSQISYALPPSTIHLNSNNCILSSSHISSYTTSLSASVLEQLLDDDSHNENISFNDISQPTPSSNTANNTVNSSTTTACTKNGPSIADSLSGQNVKHTKTKCCSSCTQKHSHSKGEDCVEMVQLSSSLFEGEPTPELLPCKHWLEVEDPHHRYGTYLRPYYDEWRVRRECATESFFEWLDQGKGQYIDMKANCSSTVSETLPTSCSSISLHSSSPPRRIRPRHYVTKDELDNSVVQYCNEEERLWYKVKVKNGQVFWANRPGKHPVDTVDDHRWIFVIDEHLNMFVNRKKKAHFHHSSFVAGAAVRTAGRIEIKHGHIQSLTPNSGHYMTSMPCLRRALFDVFGECSLPLASLRNE